MVIFLVGLVSMILMRTLRKDYARYSKEDDLDEMVGSKGVSIFLFNIKYKMIYCSDLSFSFPLFQITLVFCRRNSDRNQVKYKTST